MKSEGFPRLFLAISPFKFFFGRPLCSRGGRPLLQNMLSFARGWEVGMGVLVGWVSYVSAVVGFNVVKSVV